MKSGDFRITVEYLTCGQPRPYADSIREGYIFCEWIPYGKKEWEPVQWVDSIVERYSMSFFYWKKRKVMQENGIYRI